MTTLETIEAADWKIEGEHQMSDSAIRALTLLGFDLFDAQERDATVREAGEADGESSL